MRVSILLPAREPEPYLISRAIRNLRETAEEPEDVEVIVRLDCDDPDLAEAISRTQAFPNVRIVIGERGAGYRTLDRQWNDCAALATGHWLMLWNCDAEMLTRGWDTYLDRFTAPICVVQPTDNHNSAAFVIFPRKVYQLLGYITRHPFMDWWVNEMIDDKRHGQWPAYAEDFIRVNHTWTPGSLNGPAALEMQKDLHQTRHDYWRRLVLEDAATLNERSAKWR